MGETGPVVRADVVGGHVRGPPSGADDQRPAGTATA